MSSKSPLPLGRLVVLSGPSGAGKSTVLRELLARLPDRLELSISATTRSARPGEVDGVDYFFLSPEEFADRRQRGDFLETCEVFGRGVWYGTLKSQVIPSLEAGKSVILEIDVEGTRQVLRQYPAALTIFVRPATWEELERRLRARGTESREAVERRLTVAREELSQAWRYQHVVINDTIEHAVDQILEILYQDNSPAEERE